MKNKSSVALRSQRFADIADALARTCCASIDDNGVQTSDTLHGDIWSGTVFYCVGEMARVRGCDPHDVHGRDFVSIITALLRAQPSATAHALEKNPDYDATLLNGFAALGLAMLGDAASNPVLQSLSASERQVFADSLQVTRSYDNNWEAFNACICAGRSTLYGQASDAADATTTTTTITDIVEAIIPHLTRIADKYLDSGYFDDSENCGVYNNYGLMSINFALRIGESLDPRHPVRNHIDETFRPHALRYFSLIQDFLHHNGQAWTFGRSAGCLGQLQCLVLLEQILSKGWLDTEQAAWARSASTKMLNYMCDIFWDIGHNCFQFRDDQRSCYDYRSTLPMSWDLWRYFLQLEHYARIDEQHCPAQDNAPDINRQAICKEIVTNSERKTSFLVWGDGNDRIVLPIMGGPRRITGDTLPRPYAPGLFESVTNSATPVLCPCVRIDGADYWPAWWPSARRLIDDGDCAQYSISYAHLVNHLGQPADYDITWHCTYIFASGHFERRDTFHVGSDIHCQRIRLEVLQGSAHPRAINYPAVRQLSVSGDSNISGMELSAAEDIRHDPHYVNYYSHPSKRWVFQSTDTTLHAGDYDITTVIDYH